MNCWKVARWLAYEGSYKKVQTNLDYLRRNLVSNERLFTFQSQRIRGSDNQFCYPGNNVSHYVVWSSRVDCMVRNNSRRLKFFFFETQCLPVRHISEDNTLSFSFIRSAIEYGCAVWNSFTKEFIEKLEEVQKRYCARFVTNNGKPRDWMTPMK